MEVGLKLFTMFRKTCLRTFSESYRLRTTGPFSSTKVKEKFIKNLKDIRGCNNAHKLCGELIYAMNIFENPKTVPSSFWFTYKMNAEANIIFMQNILDKEEPELILVDMIWMVLHDATDNSGKNELMSLFMNIHKFSAFSHTEEKLREFLKQIVKDMELIIRSCEKDSLYFKYCQDYPPGGLDLLQFVLRKLTLDIAEELLYTVFQVGRAHLRFSEEQKRKIGTLMVETIEPISNAIINTKLRSNLQSSWLQKRSSLQFYKDVFAKYPTEHGTPLEHFYNDKIDGSIRRLDDLIMYWCHHASGCIAANQCEHLYESDSEDTDLEEAGASEMPKSHSWWAECSAVLNKLKSLRIS